MSTGRLCALLLLAAAAGAIQSGEELVSAVLDDCLLGRDSQPPMRCLRVKVLSYLDTLSGADGARALPPAEDSDLDEQILARVSRYLRQHEFRLQLPDFLFQRAELRFRPARGLSGLELQFPREDPAEDRALASARGMLKKKLLLPVLLLLKLKMKALTPLLLALVGMKALKALVLSKLAIMMVVGFMVSQLLKKTGMPMPMAMPMSMMPGDQYGAPAATPPAPMPYGAPPASVSTQPSSSYEPGWDSSSGPYSRVWDPQQAAYSAHSPAQLRR
ncbi:uncharacterized protein LOC134539730 [Bacillus rossius redtenbacheri]|uniref:uncharacterized protein LOC134539730 n=1 Tax=Bacillus rossius redtenbacheri TaxID=93214 RepID=UPI002FDE01B8